MKLFSYTVAVVDAAGSRSVFRNIQAAGQTTAGIDACKLAGGKNWGAWKVVDVVLTKVRNTQ